MRKKTHIPHYSKMELPLNILGKIEPKSQPSKFKLAPSTIQSNCRVMNRQTDVDVYGPEKSLRVKPCISNQYSLCMLM